VDNEWYVFLGIHGIGMKVTFLCLVFEATKFAIVAAVITTK